MTNVALIVLDTLRKDKFDEHFDWLPGHRYENAWSTSHWTVPAHASLFTGKYASEVGIYASNQLFDTDTPLLAETLSNAEYTTRMFSANPNISPTFDADRGFDMFRGSWRLEGMERNMFNWDKFIARTRDMGSERFLYALKEVVLGEYDTVSSIKRGIRLKLRNSNDNDEAIDDGATTALNLVSNSDFGDDEFLFLNLMEAHAPYHPPEEYATGAKVDIRGLDATFDEPSDAPEEIRRAYDDCVQYLADIYADIFETLQSDFDVIITLADHGELLGEHDAWEHMYGIYPELTHVPLSIYTGEDGVETVHESVNILDVYRTVLSATGVEAPAGTRGRNLLDEVEQGEHLVEYHGLHDRNYIALQNKGYDDIEYLQTEFEGIINGEYYGFETFNGFEEIGASPYEDPQERIQELTADLDYTKSDGNDDELSEQVMEQLEDLGYA
ncbi:sulfatase-like hydrolase/transferase [Haladaptatus sp. DFWS20]|uniref:sulfatase-like hydrolase/transferase n=1 Tax=Haladaptatus sp. DFWS20 TaxID=3403467 RepID=UPI003EBAE32D